MARLGIDFGTTNTVAVVEDRGLFCAVNHEVATASGTIVQDVFPSTILVNQATGRQWFGAEADRQAAQVGLMRKCTYIRSLKRHLRHYGEAQDRASFDPGELLTDFLKALAASIRASSAVVQTDEPLESVITWPANANGAQRHITRRAFQQAGFVVLDSLTEPTASAIELVDCMAGNGKAANKDDGFAVAVFDLGGGTFDASVVWHEDHQFQVLASAGIAQLGGDDLDQLLLSAFLDKLGCSADELDPLAQHALLQYVRAQKELISTGAIKSLFLNPQEFGLDGPMVAIAVAEYCEQVRPMLAPAIDKLSEVIDSAAAAHGKLDLDNNLTIYLVGGSSKLPLVTEMVRQRFATSRIVLSDKPFRSVALGAALCAVDRVSYRDVFARHFGLMRLRDHGRAETFDTIFPAGTQVPRKGEPPLEIVTSYRPAHNIGRLRYLECSALDAEGLPTGDTRRWSDILFPYDPECSLAAPSDTPIKPTDRFASTPVCEVYRCDSDGVITVELRRPANDTSRCYEIYQP
jgi:molecular chaperone HscA